MTLHLPTGGGDFHPFIKYDASAGRWKARDDNGKDQLIQNPKFVVAFEHILVGWILFHPSGRPDCQWDEPGVQTDRPGDNYKRGFKVLLYGTETRPELGKPLGLVEWMSNAGVTNAGVNKAHDLYEAQLPANPNAMPVFQCVGIEASGDNYEPVFDLVNWADKSKIRNLVSGDELLSPQARNGGVAPIAQRPSEFHDPLDDPPTPASANPTPGNDPLEQLDDPLA